MSDRMKVFSLWFWRYVLDDSECWDKWYRSDEVLPARLYDWCCEHALWVPRSIGYTMRCHCRWTAHRVGVRWYNVSGYEPDMHCLGCGEDLG